MSQQEFRNANNRYIKAIFRIFSSTDEAIVRFDGITGQLIQDSNITIDDTGNMSFAASSILGVDEIQDISGNGVMIERINNQGGMLTIGNLTANQDSSVEITALMEAFLWIEADTNDDSATEHARILLTQNANNDGIQIQYDTDNQFVIRKSGNATPTDDMIILVDATLTGGGTPGTEPTITGGTEALRIPPSGIVDFSQGISSDIVDESTVDAGVTIDSVLLKDNEVFADSYFLNTLATHFKKITRSTVISVPNGGSGVNLINYDSESGTLGSFVNATGTWTADITGIYVGYYIAEFASNSNGTRNINWLYSGSSLFGLTGITDIRARSGASTLLTSNWVFNIQSGDTLIMRAFQNSGVALNLTGQVFISLIYS